MDNEPNHLVLIHPTIEHSVPKYYPKEDKISPRISLAFDYNLDAEPLFGVRNGHEDNPKFTEVLIQTVAKVHNELEVPDTGVNKLLFQIYRDINYKLADKNLLNRDKYIDLYKKLSKRLEYDNNSAGGWGKGKKIV
jgi:hypothetical protein